MPWIGPATWAVTTPGEDLVSGARKGARAAWRRQGSSPEGPRPAGARGAKRVEPGPKGLLGSLSPENCPLSIGIGVHF